MRVIDPTRLVPIRLTPTLLAAACLLPLLAPGSGRAAGPEAGAASAGPVRVTVIADLDDDIYDARAGRGGVDATRMAVADFGGTVLGRPVVVDALNDHNKPALAPGLATQAYDAGASLLMDVQNSPIALAVAKVATERQAPDDHHRRRGAGPDAGRLHALRLPLLLRQRGDRGHHRRLPGGTAGGQALGDDRGGRRVRARRRGHHDAGGRGARRRGGAHGRGGAGPSRTCPRPWPT